MNGLAIAGIALLIAVPPVGVTVTTPPIIWIADPFVSLFLGTLGDIYSNPWGW